MTIHMYVYTQLKALIQISCVKVWGKVSPKLQLLKSKVVSVTGSKMEDMVNRIIIVSIRL